MRTIGITAAAITLLVSGCPAPEQAAKRPGTAARPSQQAKRRRGFATVQEQRPQRFPHRIWAACGFEAKTPAYGWFGAKETENIRKYPGSVTALRARGPYKRFAALMVGMNPVPGPRMGKVNKMYCRYFLKGGSKATFQHFSLSSSDNCNIRVSGLSEGKWSEVTLNFTRDSRRNDGRPGAFKEGERMDDLKVFVGKPDDGSAYEMLIDDVIFFAEDAALPPEPEPFPNRVIFLAAFDTGIGSQKDLDQFFPGTYKIARRPPAGSYWAAVQAVPAEDHNASHVRLKLSPLRHVGRHTKLRFRYWLSGASSMKVVLHDVTANADRIIEIKHVKKDKWVTRYLDFTRDSRAADAGGKPLAVGNKVDSLDFIVPGTGEQVKLYVDEVVLFDAGKPMKR